MSEPQSKTQKASKKKLIILMGLGLLIPIFLVGMAILAVKSDEKNQQKYAQQRAEMNERINAAVAAEKLKEEQVGELPASEANLKSDDLVSK